MTEKLNASMAEYDAAAEELQHAAVKRKQIRAMIAALEGQDGPLDQFDEGLWSGLGDSMTVY